MTFMLTLVAVQVGYLSGSSATIITGRPTGAALAFSILGMAALDGVLIVCCSLA